MRTSLTSARAGAMPDPGLTIAATSTAATNINRFTIGLRRQEGAMVRVPAPMIGAKGAPAQNGPRARASAATGRPQDVGALLPNQRMIEGTTTDFALSDRSRSATGFVNSPATLIFRVRRW